MKPTSVLSLLFATFASSVMAQDNPVLVTDVVTSDKVSSVMKTITIPGQCADYSLYSFETSPYYVAFHGSRNCALYTARSSGLVSNIVIEWINNSGKDKTIVFYSKGEPYSKRSELYDVNTRGTEIGRINRTSLTTSTDYSDKVEFDNPYRHWGMAVESEDVNLARIIVTWKLAYTRENITPGNLGTICLPYDVAKEQLGGVKLYSIAGKAIIDGTEAIVCDEEDHIEAGRPYLFTSESSSLFLLYSNPQSCATEQKGTNGFYGNLEATTVGDLRNGGDDDVYVVSGNSIKKATDAVGIGANRAYIRRSQLLDLGQDVASSSRFLLSEKGFAPFGGGYTTALSSLSDNSASDAGAVYDLNGRPAAAAKGIVVRKGRVQMQ